MLALAPPSLRCVAAERLEATWAPPEAQLATVLSYRVEVAPVQLVGRLGVLQIDEEEELGHQMENLQKGKEDLEKTETALAAALAAAAAGMAGAVGEAKSPASGKASFGVVVSSPGSAQRGHQTPV